ncbi:MAG: hypothetical protein A2W28_12025 [Gammaproteobacteria bacterium RBG_16_51_14]|nr:MAG: hypothetical protein A2W28_12025 [Gammaproteobacteria bacterium RBG_16_51_14]
MNTFQTYPAKVEQDDKGRVLVTFPDIPHAATDGSTLDEALEEAIDCLEEAIAGYIYRNELIPAPSRIKRGQYTVSLCAQMALKALLYQSVREEGISKVELAERMGINEREVRRMLDPRHGSKLPRIEEALHVLGRHLIVRVEAA